jgi:hypothetical protein
LLLRSTAEQERQIAPPGVGPDGTEYGHAGIRRGLLGEPPCEGRAGCQSGGSHQNLTALAEGSDATAPPSDLNPIHALDAIPVTLGFSGRWVWCAKARTDEVVVV